MARGETHGIPVLVKTGNTLAAVWEDASGQVLLAKLGLKNESQKGRVTVAEGRVPTAVEKSTTIVTAYIASQSVWVVPIQLNH